MSKTLVINSSNYVIGSGNKFVYRFPNTVNFESGSSIGLSSISIYNSTFNIEKSRGNNTIQILWLGITYTIVIDDGYYTVNDLNFRIQQFCILNNLYMTSNGGSNIIYFVELVMNSVRYSVQLNLYAIPTEAQSLVLGYSKVGSTWNFPLVATTPQLNILNSINCTSSRRNLRVKLSGLLSRGTIELLIVVLMDIDQKSIQLNFRMTVIKYLIVALLLPTGSSKSILLLNIQGLMI